MDITKYIGETTAYDKKQEVERRKVKSWLKSVSAFANGAGGCLIFGVSDSDELIGLADAKSDAEFISQKIKERIDPVPQMEMKIEQYGDKTILFLFVEHGDDTPYYYIGDGVLETFMRIGNETVIADATEHKRLVLRGRNASFDSRPSDEHIDDYAFTKLRERYHTWNGVSFDNKLFRSFGMVDTKGILTNAGLLMADECPLRQSKVFCTRWNGKTRGGGTVDALDSAEYSGSMVRLIDETMTFIRRNMHTIWYKEPMQRIEIPEYIERSVLEVLVNALAHRDYLIQGSEVHVDMYDDRLVVYSPGSMPEGRIIQNMDLSDIPSIRRNPVIADILAHLGFMERKGSGMGKIMNAYKALPYITDKMLPTFFSDRAQFTVIFPNIVNLWKAEYPNVETGTIESEEKTTSKATLKTTSKTTSELPQLKDGTIQAKIFELLKEEPSLTMQEIASRIGGITKDGIKYHLNILQKDGVVKHDGPTRGGRWIIIK